MLFTMQRWRWAATALLGVASALSLGAASVRTASEPYAFQVRITLSPKAAATLDRLHEGIVISASYAGDPKPSATKHADESGRIDLGVQSMEIPGRTATVIVNGSGVQRGRLAWVRGPLLLNVNVYSARRSGPDNILDCDFFDGTLRSAGRRPVPLHCGLIAEHPPTQHRS